MTETIAPPKSKILEELNQAQRAIAQLEQEKNLLFIEQVAERIAQAFLSGNKVIIAGNGGSLCDASHFAEELTGFFKEKRRALPAIVLSEPGHLSCVANDIGYEWVFARGVEAYGKEGDVFIALSTSGNSESVLRALVTAKEMKLTTVSFLGKTGGRMLGMADFEMHITQFSTSDHIQEAHMTAMHIIISLIEDVLF